VQLKSLRKVKGLEKVEIFRPGYAIEYDFFQPTQLKHTLETKRVGNLYFAGQINGTTGDEEAAAQGLMAGINAVLKLRKQDTFILGRDESYIGVLIDDLVTKGVDEPYRMFTSRAEYRILLRQDNSDERLTRKAFGIGTVKQDRIDRLEEKERFINQIISFLSDKSVSPEEINTYLEKYETSIISQKQKAISIAARPQVELAEFLKILDGTEKLEALYSPRFKEICESAEIAIKYEGYIVREKLIAQKITRLENVKIPDDISYVELASISTEARQKLTRIKPANIGHASRISGVSPSDINILLMYLGR
jgi:tRNA uridine 5-carboxymethylaminomethyl modification enzyme